MGRLHALRTVVEAPLRRALGRAGPDSEAAGPARWPTPPDADERARATIEAVAPFTLTPPERILGLISAVRYLVRAGIEGDVAECGVWRGGSMMAAARTLVEEGDTSRVLHLYDTFEHMPLPDERDVDLSGRPALEDFTREADPAEVEPYQYVPLDAVQDALASTGYPAERLRFVAGLVEDTLPAQAPDRLALLRLDTDWYRSTRHELEHLFPRIVDGGVLIIDDYGHFAGARDAVDEYLAEQGIELLLTRLDYSARLAVIRR